MLSLAAPPPEPPGLAAGPPLATPPPPAVEVIVLNVDGVPLLATVLSFGDFAPPPPTVIGKVVAVTVTPAGAALGFAGYVAGAKLGVANLNPPAPPPPPTQPPPPPPATTKYSTALFAEQEAIELTVKSPGPVNVANL